MRLLQLLDHAGALLFRVVELGEGIAEFPGVAVGLETLDEARFTRHFLGKRRDVLREMRDVRRLDQRRLDLLLEDEGQALAPGTVLLRSDESRVGKEGEGTCK